MNGRLKVPAWNPSAATLRRIPLFLFCAVMVTTAGTALLTSLATGDFHQTWNVLTGTVPPSGDDWGWLYFVLSVLGYFVVPIVVALAVTDAVGRFIARRQTDDTLVENDTERRLNEALEAYNKHQRGGG